MSSAEKEWRDILDKAIQEQACAEAITVLSKFKTWDETVASEHPKLAGWAYWYAAHVIKGPWPLGEDLILKEVTWVCSYAENIIKGRWEKGEPKILTNPIYAYLYTRYVLKKPWEEAEKVIYAKNDDDISRKYAEFVRMVKAENNA